MEKLYTVQDLCERYGVKDFTVWDWIRKGKIKAYKIGKSYRFYESDVMAFENAQKNVWERVE